MVEVNSFLLISSASAFISGRWGTVGLCWHPVACRNVCMGLEIYIIWSFRRRTENGVGYGVTQ